MSRAKIIDYYLEKSKQPGFEIDQIRKDLSKNNVDEEEIRVIVKIVDSEIQRGQIRKEENKLSSVIVVFGSVIFTAGVIVTIGTFTGLIDTGRSYLIAYGPVLSGLSILFFGLARKRK